MTSPTKILRDAPKKKWRVNNAVHISAYNAERYANNPEPQKQQALTWAKDNPQKVKEIQAAYYRRRKAFRLRFVGPIKPPSL